MSANVTSANLAAKSVQAAISAIELYNKPDFQYREESFSILMCNAWELLLKAKAVREGGESLEAVFVYEKPATAQGADKPLVKVNRSGNALTVGLGWLVKNFLETKVEGFSKECAVNIELLIEVRDNAVHFLNSDFKITKKILEIGTASLKNYMMLATQWFAIDFSKYNFFLMPLSFFHNFDSSRALLPKDSEQINRFLQYLSKVEMEQGEDTDHFVTLSIDLKLIKRKGSEEGTPVRWTDDQSAPALVVKEEDLFVRYPYDASDLAKKLRDKYKDFKLDKRYYKLRKPLDADGKYCMVRYLDKKNPRSGSKKFFSSEVFKVFDLHYTKKA